MKLAMLWICLSLLLLLASRQTLAAGSSPESLGMLDSPQAYAEACSEARTSTRAMGDKANSDSEVALAAGLLACYAVIDGVDTAVRAAKDYTLSDGTRICPTRGITRDAVLDRFIEIEREQRADIASEHLTSSAVVLMALGTLGTCPGR